MNIDDFSWEPGLPADLKKWVDTNVKDAIKAFTCNLYLMPSDDIGKLWVGNEFDHLFEPPLDLRKAFNVELDPGSLDPRDPEHLQWAEYLEELARDIRDAVEKASQETRAQAAS